MMSLLVFTALTALGGPPRDASSETDPRTEELRREVKALRAEMQALRLSLAELAELDRQRATVIMRLLESKAPVAVEERAPPPEPPKPATPAIPANPSNPAVSATTGVVTGRVQVPPGEPVAYVYVENVSAPAVRGQSVVIEQSKKQFSPTWAVIQKGTTVKFPNLDNVYHNVFSRSAGNSFDLGLYNSTDEGKSHTFFEAGPVDVYCNIHPRMSASVLVVPSRHFTKVKADGTFELTGVPPGKRKIVAWAPSSSPRSEWIQLAAGDRADVTLVLEPKSTSHKNKDGRAYTSYE